MAKKAARPQPQRPNQPSDRGLAYGTVPLRLFLGATFVYAGLQKIADPGFLQPGASTYIGTQLQGFAANSPIGFLLQIFALPAPQLAGIGVIAGELVIGVLVLLGLARLTGWDDGYEVAANLGLAAAACLALFSQWRSTAARLGWAWANGLVPIISLLVFALTQWENWV